MESANMERYGLKPVFSPGSEMRESIQGIVSAQLGRVNYDGAKESFLLTPGMPRYLSPLVPTNQEAWLPSAQRMVGLSFAHLIADTWTQLLSSKRDHKEKPIYLFWDDEIPKPNRATALAWLLICETWPMQTHLEGPTLASWTDLFPFQSFLLPQSSAYGYASNRPVGYATGMYSSQGKGLTSLLTQSMHREDRQRMETMFGNPQVYRPRVKNFTSYGAHLSPEKSTEYDWQRFGPWPRQPSLYYDMNLGGDEIRESDYHLRVVEQLRSQVMRDLFSIPGMPTCRHNLFYPAGMWIRHWSEAPLSINALPEPLAWTANNESIALNTGGALKTVPNSMPRIWWGWSQIGPDESARGQMQVAPLSASERWVESYLKHRDHALTCLFAPHTIDVHAMREESLGQRSAALTKSGRIKKQSETTATAMAAAFANLMNQKDKENDDG